jgi:hypothetical protein
MHVDHTWSFVQPLYSCPWQPCTLNKVQYPTDRGVLKVPWFHTMTAQVPESYLAKASQSQTCISAACLYPSHSGLCTSPSLNWCPFKLQCPVSILSWFLLKLSNSPALLAKGLLRRPFTCPRPRMDFHYYACFLFVYPLPIVVDKTRGGWGPTRGHKEPCLASCSAKQFGGLYCLQLPLKIKCQDHSSSNMASYPRGTGSSASLLWEPQIWHDDVHVAAYNTQHTSVNWCCNCLCVSDCTEWDI